ncbi:MAG: DUF1045 domain-containing protein [Alphaproteobacteria bacterium]|nr:DUF1045 domain-containing protein [Alphaproteobacteria bacterium]
MSKTRYAIYYTPCPDSPLWAFGASWLGRDDQALDSAKRLKVKGFKASEVADITAGARLYGFHATLKAPFRLADGYDLEMLDEAIEAFACAREPAVIHPWELTELDGFVALRPKKPGKALCALAAACVREFDHFRAPMTKEERRRREKMALGERQMKLMKKWGYPFVLEEFRFHMSLSERLKPKDRAVLIDALRPHAEPFLGKKALLDRLSLFRQKEPGKAFEMVKSYPLRALRDPRIAAKSQKRD